MTIELLRPGYSNISYTKDQCAFSGTVMSTEATITRCDLSAAILFKFVDLIAFKFTQ